MAAEWMLLDEWVEMNLTLFIIFHCCLHSSNANKLVHFLPLLLFFSFKHFYVSLTQESIQNRALCWSKTFPGLPFSAESISWSTSFTLSSGQSLFNLSSCITPVPPYPCDHSLVTLHSIPSWAHCTLVTLVTYHLCGFVYAIPSSRCSLAPIPVYWIDGQSVPYPSQNESSMVIVVVVIYNFLYHLHFFLQ